MNKPNINKLALYLCFNTFIFSLGYISSFLLIQSHSLSPLLFPVRLVEQSFTHILLKVSYITNGQ